MLRNCSGVCSRDLRGDGRVELLARHGRLRADLAGRDLDVLRQDRGLHVGRRQADSCCSLNGSSQMRIAYGAPNTCVWPTPVTRDERILQLARP